MPIKKNLSKTVIVTTQHACAMVLVGVDRRLPVKIRRRFIRQSFLQGVKWAAHFRALIAQIEEKPFVKFSMSGKEVLRLVQGTFVVPPQAGTSRDVGLKQFGSRNENVNCQQPAERMSNENLIGRNAVAPFNLRHEFVPDEIDEVIGSAAGGIGVDCAIGIFLISVTGRRVSRAVGVGNANDDQRRRAIIQYKKIHGAGHQIDVGGTIRQVKHRKWPLSLLVILRSANPNNAVFVQDVGMYCQLLRNGWRYVLRGKVNREQTKGQQRTSHTTGITQH